MKLKMNERKGKENGERIERERERERRNIHDLHKRLLV